jgi:hypothetical protein
MNKYIIQLLLFFKLIKECFTHQISSYGANISVFKITNDCNDDINITNVKKKYLLNKLFFKYFDINGDFYCIIHNKHGVCKTILKNTNLTNIANIQPILNITEKTDNLYNNKLIDIIKIIYQDETFYDLTNDIINIDKSLNLSFEYFLILNRIKHKPKDLLYIKYTDCESFDDSIIINKIDEYYLKSINNLLT